MPWLERFPGRQAALRAGLRFLRDERADWSAAIDRVLAVIEGAPLFNPAGSDLMAGYLIVEERMMQPSKAGGVAPYPPLPWPAGFISASSARRSFRFRPATGSGWWGLKTY